MEYSNRKGESIKYDYNPLNQENINSLINLIEKEDYGISINYLILEKVKDIISGYIQGKIDINKAVSTIQNSVEVYLSE